jgi:HSP20 family protein
VRYRKITYRYAEVVGGLSRAFEAELWGAMRPQALASPLFRPPADVIETPAAYVVVVEVPGVAEDAMEVSVHPDALVVSGHRDCLCIEGARYHAAEIRYGPFRFDMALPADADPERVDATTDRGLVRIVIGRRRGGIA